MGSALAPSGGTHQWRKIRQRVFDRDGRECAFCGHTGDKDNPLTVDHVLPRSLGGSDNLNNLRILCRVCNSSRRRTSRGRGSSGRVAVGKGRMATVVHDSPFTRGGGA